MGRMSVPSPLFSMVLENEENRYFVLSLGLRDFGQIA